MGGEQQAKVLEKYNNTVRNIPVSISIIRKKDSHMLSYNVSISGISRTTEIVLEEIQEDLIKKMNLDDFSVDEKTGSADESFRKEAMDLISSFFPHSNDRDKEVLLSYLLSRSLGIGYVDFLLHDHYLEEITIDSSEEPVRVYHRKHGWLRTNIFMSTEEQIRQTAARIGRNVGRQLNTLNPLLDAYLSTGERVNATITPITPKGNTITIRKFSEDPWTITRFIANKTLTSEVAALLWQVIHYEMSILVVGGTASGKTSTLNALANFIPPNQRIISIEDTRELGLASYLYWVPMMTRLPNAEGKGGINMEDLLVNSLRMRPDRILVGEVRRHKDAETMFEAIHTGHSVYGTFHANNSHEAIARLTSEPVNVPKALLSAINLMLVQFRNRRTGMRRTLEVSEVTEGTEFNMLYKYDAKRDILVPSKKTKRLLNDLSVFTGLSEKELSDDLKERKFILDAMVHLKIFNVENVGKIMADYYDDKKSLISRLKKAFKKK